MHPSGSRRRWRILHSKEGLVEIEANIDKLEQRIVNFFSQSTSEYGRDLIMATIIGHFFLRRDLTQKSLQELTGYSVGAISQALKQLIKQGVVKEQKPEGRGAYRYTIENISTYLIHSFENIAKLYTSAEPDFLEIQQGLSRIPEDQHSDQLYQNIKGYISSVLRFTKLYKETWEFMEKEVNKLK